MSRRVALFVDGPNFFYMQKGGLEWFADPKKIYDWVSNHFPNATLADARYYQSVDARKPNNSTLYLAALPHIGFAVKTKALRQRNDDEGNYVSSNIDCYMMFDMFASRDNYDTCVLLSGSGNFAPVVERLVEDGKQVIILATEKFLSKELLSKVGSTCFVEMNDIRHELEKDVMSYVT